MSRNSLFEHISYLGLGLSLIAFLPLSIADFDHYTLYFHGSVKYNVDARKTSPFYPDSCNSTDQNDLN